MKYLKGNQDLAKKQGYLQSPYTKRLRFNLTATEASNWVIQNLNSEAMKIALYNVWKYINDHNVDAKIINTVHDSIVVEIKEGENYSFIKDIMADSLSLFLEGIKGDADIVSGKEWRK